MGQTSADPYLEATVMLALSCISICSDVEFPPDISLISAVLVVVLGRKPVVVIGRDFPLAT